MSKREWTVIEILKVARDYLQERGVENARGNAESLVGKVLGMGRVQLYLHYDRPLAVNELELLRDLLKRRAQHEPLQLLLGSVEFCGVHIEVAPGLLIPRPETEEMTARLIEDARAAYGENHCRVLDIGSGTGCISVAIARALPASRIDALDVEYEAVQCTERNARSNGVADRVRAQLGDLYSPKITELLSPPYDAIVSNPPYVAERELAQLPPEVRNHESRRALIAGASGLECIERISELLYDLGHSGTLIAIEFGYGQEAAVRGIFEPLLSPFSIHADLAGVPRVLSGRLT